MNLNILPTPKRVKCASTDRFLLNNSLELISNFHDESLSKYYKNEICRYLPVNFDVTSHNSYKVILNAENSDIQNEGYILSINKENCIISAKDKKGFINALQTLVQIAINEETGVSLIECEIEDYPDFSYRGLHLDVVRHMFPIDYIFKYIDFLTFHKLNKFHWHLTDDQGWRIESRAYPLLNTVGSWRERTQINHSDEEILTFEEQRYGGYYSVEEITQVINYADERGVEVIPEIDIPGHSRAAIAAYPQLGTEPNAGFQVADRWCMYNLYNNVLSPNDFTFEFLETVFKEAAEIFPSKYFHLGGDECSKRWWNDSKDVKEFMINNQISDEFHLQTYFVEYVTKVLSECGKRSIGWHEILEGDIPKDAIIMNWGDDANCLEAVKRGHEVVMSPGKPVYFDHYQSIDKEEGVSLGGYNPLIEVYKFNPIPKELQNTELAGKIIGAQANLWTEYIRTTKKLEIMLFPRLTAFAEAVWNYGNKAPFEQFVQKLDENILRFYKIWGVEYYKLPKNF